MHHIKRKLAQYYGHCKVNDTSGSYYGKLVRNIPTVISVFSHLYPSIVVILMGI
jgi:hypothetical protein